MLARDQVHEAGHNWLNDALTSTGCKLSEKETSHSPWRNSQRPAFGFLHACWAFPPTMIYTARALDQTSDAVHRFLARHLDQHRRLLATTTTDHASALALVPHPGLRQRLRHVYAVALSL